MFQLHKKGNCKYNKVYSIPIKIQCIHTNSDLILSIILNIFFHVTFIVRKQPCIFNFNIIYVKWYIWPSLISKRLHCLELFNLETYIPVIHFSRYLLYLLCFSPFYLGCQECITQSVWIAYNYKHFIQTK